jgi:hypothetical protein
VDAAGLAAGAAGVYWRHDWAPVLLLLLLPMQVCIYMHACWSACTWVGRT